jgi:urease accessory protein
VSAFAAYVAARWRENDRHGKADEHAAARLIFRCGVDGVTYLAEQQVGYPFHITKPFRLEPAWPELATLYLQSVSGGLFQGDRLALACEAEAGAAVQLTTQAATKVHSMERDFAVQTAKLKARSGAYLEYLADPAILFPKSRMLARITLEIPADAEALLSDSFLFHDPAQESGGERLPAFDAYAAEVLIEDEARRVLAADRFLIETPKAGHGNPALAAGYLAQGAVYAVSRRKPAEIVASALRASLDGRPEVYAGVSALPNGAGAFARVLASDGASLRAALDALAAAARRALVGKAMSPLKK